MPHVNCTKYPGHNNLSQVPSVAVCSHKTYRWPGAHSFSLVCGPCGGQPCGSVRGSGGRAAP